MANSPIYGVGLYGIPGAPSVAIPGPAPTGTLTVAAAKYMRRIRMDKPIQELERYIRKCVAFPIIRRDDYGIPTVDRIHQWYRADPLIDGPVLRLLMRSSENVIPHIESGFLSLRAEATMNVN